MTINVMLKIIKALNNTGNRPEVSVDELGSC